MPSPEFDRVMEMIRARGEEVRNTIDDHRLSYERIMAQLPMESTKKTIIAMLAISPVKGNFLVVWFDWVTPTAPRTMPAAKIRDNRPMIFWPRVVGVLMLDEYSPLVES